MQETIYDLSNKAYHFESPYTEYLSSSQLKLYAKSPKLAKWEMEHPTELQQSDALFFGSLFHDLMASLAQVNADWESGFKSWFNSLAIFTPPINAKTNQPYGTSTKAYQDELAAFIAANPDKTLVDEKTYGAVASMAYSLIFNCGSTTEQVKKLLRWGKPEVSHFVEYQGSKFKYRPDLESKRKIVDWKTAATDDLSEKSINSIIAKFGYDISAAFYLFLEHERTGVWKHFYWVFVSKQAPYDAVMVDSSNWTYSYDEDNDICMPQVGAIKMKALLDLHLQCAKSGDYPGAEIFIPKDEFSDTRIMLPTPPTWEVNNAANLLANSSI